jgi:ABC-type enterobactin transport system permease subunit
VLYPFALDGPLAFVASNNPQLELRLEGAGSQWVALRR